MGIEAHSKALHELVAPELEIRVFDVRPDGSLDTNRLFLTEPGTGRFEDGIPAYSVARSDRLDPRIGLAGYSARVGDRLSREWERDGQRSR